MGHELEVVIACPYPQPQVEVQWVITSEEPFRRYRVVWMLTMIQGCWLPVREDLMPSLVEN